MKIIFTYFFAFVSICSYGQIIIAGKTGIQITNMNIKRDLNFYPTTSQLNPLVGISAEFEFKNSLSISGELLYAPFSYRASKMEVIDDNGNDLGEIKKHKIAFIQIPIALNYNFLLEKSKIKLGLGPVLNLKLNEKYKTINPSNMSSSAQILNTSGTLTSNLGIYFNTGIAFTTFGFNLHAQKSITGIYKTRFSNDIKFNGNSFGFSFLYFIKKPKK
jgi:hypothetical protein